MVPGRVRDRERDRIPEEDDGAGRAVADALLEDGTPGRDERDQYRDAEAERILRDLTSAHGCTPGRIRRTSTPGAVGGGVGAADTARASRRPTSDAVRTGPVTGP